MPKRLFKRLTPDHNEIRNHRRLRVVAGLFKDPNLWHLNRRSIAGACFVGLFWAFVPLPGQMFGAVFTAVLLRVNVPLSFALIWVTNPVTIPPMFYFAYRLGAQLLGREVIAADIELSMSWLSATLGQIWAPLLLGSLLCGLALGALGYLTVRLFWRWHVIQRYRQRHAPKPRKTPSVS